MSSVLPLPGGDQFIPVPTPRPATDADSFQPLDLSGLPPLPNGFTLDAQEHTTELPPLPEGFVLDTASAAPVKPAEAESSNFITEVGKGIAAGAANVAGLAAKGIAANEARSPAEEQTYADLVADLPRVKDMTPEEWGEFQRKAMTGIRGANEMNLLVTAANIRNGVTTLEESKVPLDVLPKQELEDVPLFKTGRKMQEFAEDKLAAAKSYEDTWTRSISEGLGSTVPFLAAGVAGPIVSTAVGAGVGSASSAGEAIDRAVAAGATKTQIMEAARYGQLPGLTEQVPIETLLERVPLPHMGKVIGAVGKVVAQAAVEGGQEAAQQAAQNIIARYVYKPEQDVTEGPENSRIASARLHGRMRSRRIQ